MKSFFKNIILSLLTLEARFILWRFEPKIIVVTGSVGKTSTKDAVFTAIHTSFKTRKSEKSFNSDIGVPLTILNVPNAWGNPLFWISNVAVGALKSLFLFRYPEYLVLEVGADKPGDIKELMKWIKPHVVVVTRFPKVPVHVEFYKDPEELIKEEAYPAEVLKDDGVLILNDDDEKVLGLKDNFRGRSITYGLTPRAMVSGGGEEVFYKKTEGAIEIPEGIVFPVMCAGREVSFEIKHGLGITHIYPTLAAVAVATSLGIDLEKIRKAFEKHQLTSGRMCIIEGIKGVTIIDDTYNASPVATEVALRTLSKLKSKRNIAMLGSMKELGSFSKDEHLRIGSIASEICDILVTVGVEARDIAEGALGLGMDEKHIYQFEDSKEAGKFMETIIKEGDLVLIKGSQSIRMERAVEELMLRPNQKEKLLVRQEEAWMKK